jgi:hypothetical protein
MPPIPWIIAAVCLLLILIWPPFSIVVLLALVILALCARDHKTGDPPPFWNWGKDPSHEVLVKWWSEKELDVYLKYQQLNQNENPIHGDKWISIMDNFEANKEIQKLNLQIPPRTRHSFPITDLHPDTKYRFEIIDAQTQQPVLKGRENIFHTQSSEFAPFRFVACGDMQQSELLAVLEQYMIWKIARERPKFVLFMGDHVHSYKKHELWFAFFRIMRLLLPKVPFYPTIGNHCGGDNGITAGAKYLLHPFNRPLNWNYTWQYQNIFFISINSMPLLEQNQPEIEKTEAWLKEQINSRPSTATFTIVYMHVPWIGQPYATNGQPSHYELYLEKQWKPILDDPRVDAIFSGHKHSYIRSGKYFVTASLHGVRKYPEAMEADYVARNTHHYLLIEVEKQRLMIKAKRWNGKIHDEYSIKK